MTLATIAGFLLCNGCLAMVGVACKDEGVSDMKRDLHRYLQSGRDALVWKLDGLSEYDIRRPLVPTGTNLLGLVKHLASVEFGYFGVTFGRPPTVELAWWHEDAEANADMWQML